VGSGKVPGVRGVENARWKMRGRQAELCSGAQRKKRKRKMSSERGKIAKQRRHFHNRRGSKRAPQEQGAVGRGAWHGVVSPGSALYIYYRCLRLHTAKGEKPERSWTSSSRKAGNTFPARAENSKDLKGAFVL